MNNIELRSIGNLVDRGEKFFIPDYQRGYRWSRQQVKDLLEDLLDFQQRGAVGIYCLQPLVVKGRVSDKAVEMIRQLFNADTTPSLETARLCRQ